MAQSFEHDTVNSKQKQFKRVNVICQYLHFANGQLIKIAQKTNSSGHIHTHKS